MIRSLLGCLLVGLVMGILNAPVLALPPPDDVPEEILRTEIITDARSPVDGDRLTAAQYAELQEHLQDSPPPILNPQVRQTIFLLQIRRAIRTVAPFLLN